MASVIEFDVSGDQAAAKSVVQAAAVAQGFAVEATSDWSFLLTRGSSTKSLLLGALAGKDFYLKFGLDFSVADGHLVVRLSRDVASTAIRGGVIGATKASGAFQQLADAVGTAVTQAGTFLANRIVS
ncbi:MAG TPA: hypothetical protein VGM38_09995 [Pseudolysinimonas sp.]|jgi:hypothetical protein